MNARFIDWIWHVRGNLALAPGQSSDEIFGRLAPLFRQSGTTHARTDDRLTFAKKDQAAQDRMSVFDGGVLQVEAGEGGSVLRYHLTSRALLFCFLLPLLFLGFAQLTIAMGKMDKPHAEVAGKNAAASPKKKEVELPQSPIDKFLGAPAPEKPKDKAKGGADDDDKKPSPKPGYIFAGIFAFLYVVGRIMESRKVRTLFEKSLRDAAVC